MNRNSDATHSAPRRSPRAAESSTELRLLNQTEGIPSHDGSPRPPSHIQCGNRVSLHGIHTLSSKLRQYRAEFFFVFATLVLSIFAFYYSFEALIDPNPALGKLYFTPPTTVFVINVLSQGVAWMLKIFFASIFELLRWNFACRTTGVPLTTFLTLSAGTSLPGVFILLGTSGQHQWWCAQRYLIRWLV